MLELLSAIGSILLVDIALSGDNALVIGAAASGLPRSQRSKAILAGGAAAVILRIVFASLASFLLLLPWLQAIGGIILLSIAIRLLVGRQQKNATVLGTHKDEPGKENQATVRTFFTALLTILVADVTMSLDNVLAVGALAHGNLLALSLGLLLSVILLLIGSTIVAGLIKRLPWLLDIAALVLAWTGANMMLEDQHLGDVLNDYSWTAIAIPAAALCLVLAADLLFRWRDHRLARSL